jgi:hypothetical protein
MIRCRGSSSPPTVKASPAKRTPTARSAVGKTDEAFLQMRFKQKAAVARTNAT